MKEDEGEKVAAQVLPEWLLRLDQAAALLMTLNTVTLMLGMGAATYWKEFWDHLRQPWACLVGMACQFILLPAVGFGLCLAFHLPPYQALGVLILACCPGGAFSNFFTFWVDGDLALSIIMTALSSLVALGVMPLNMWLYTRRWTDQEVQVPYINILVSLVIVTAPVLVGMMARHFNRKVAGYLSKVCSMLGWAGALTCGVLLILRYWDTIVKSSIYLVIIAAITPFTGFLAAYIIVRLLCFSHKICWTVAIETGCQNMMVAISIILLSFSDPQVRGQMVLFPVLYGLCQLAEVLVATALFQTWLFVHRHDVTEERVISVVDTSLLTSIPVPAHKVSQAPEMEQVAEYSMGPVGYDGSTLASSASLHLDASRYRLYPPSEREWPRGEETHPFLPRGPNTQASRIQWDEWTPGIEPTTSNLYFTYDQDSTTDYHQGDSSDMEPCSDCVLEYGRPYDSDEPCSPTLSNKGVPNMFPVTERDFKDDSLSDDEEDAPLPYGRRPIPSCRERPLPSETIGRQGTEGSSPTTTAAPTSPTSPSSYARPFAFYHGDVRLGETQQFSTFGRK